MTPDHLESIANHPRVIRAIGCNRERFSAGDSWADSIGCEWESGGVVFHEFSPRHWSAHLVFAPKTRDVPAKCAEALAYLFTHTDALAVWGMIPTRLKHACRIARQFLNHEGDQDGRSFYRLTAEEFHGRK